MPDCHPLMKEEFAKAGLDVTDPKIAKLLECVYEIHDAHIDEVGDHHMDTMHKCPGKTLRRAAIEFPSYTRDMVSRDYVVKWLNTRADEHDARERK